MSLGECTLGNMRQQHEYTRTSGYIINKIPSFSLFLKMPLKSTGVKSHIVGKPQASAQCEFPKLPPLMLPPFPWLIQPGGHSVCPSIEHGLRTHRVRPDCLPCMVFLSAVGIAASRLIQCSQLVVYKSICSMLQVSSLRKELLLLLLLYSFMKH